MTFWFFVRVVSLAAVAAATALLALIGAQVLTEPSWVVYLLASYIGATTITGQTIRLAREQLLWPSEEQRSGIREYLFAALLTIEQESEISCGALGLNLWLIPRWWQLLPRWARRTALWVGHQIRKVMGRVRHPIRGDQEWISRTGSALPPRRYPRLRRIERVRLAERAPCRVRWTFKKGAIGECWSERKQIGFNCWEKYGDFLTYDQKHRPIGVDINGTEWAELGSDIRLGLTFREFGEIAGKYGAVIVTPLYLAGKRWLGCITLDVAWGDHYDHLWCGAVLDALADAAWGIEGKVLKVAQPG